MNDSVNLWNALTPDCYYHLSGGISYRIKSFQPTSWLSFESADQPELIWRRDKFPLYSIFPGQFRVKLIDRIDLCYRKEPWDVCQVFTAIYTASN